MRLMTKGSTMQRHAHRNPARGSRKQKLTHACRRVLIDQLESRVLLSTGGAPDPGFGQGGYLPGYQVLAVQQDGSLIAWQHTSSASNFVQLHPDGSFEAAYDGAPPTPPPTNVQNNGDYLEIYGNALARYDSSSGSIDTTFGNNGFVTDFSSGTGYPAGAFNPENVTVVGNQIIVGGPLNLGGEGHDSATALVRLNSNGSIDHTFGTNGIAKGSDVSQVNDVRTYQMLVGPNGNYFVSGEFDGRPLLTEFSPAGAYINSAHLVNGGGDQIYSLGFSRNNVYMLTDWTSTEVALAAYDLNLHPDIGFGNNGMVVVTPPDHPPTQIPQETVPGPMIVDPDGRIFFSGHISYSNTSNTGGDYAIAYLPDWGANTSVSGFVYNDANGNGKMDSGEAPLRYWQVFVDLNNNGVFDRHDATANADYNGYYKIHGLDPGTYNVYEVLQPGWKSVQPYAPPYHRFTVSAGQVSTGNDFGNAKLSTFQGNNNVLAGYSVQQVLPNGVIVVQDSSGTVVGLDPDGTIDPTFNPATDVPPTPLPGVYQSDGKRLVLDTTNSTITRYNADGSIDRTFGTNGTFSGFAQQPTQYLGNLDSAHTPPFQNTTFAPKMIALQGNNIIVSGTMSGTLRDGNSFSGELAVERITSDGFQDNGFGVVVYIMENQPIGDLYALYVANGGQIYILAADIYDDGYAIRFSGDGTTAKDVPIFADTVTGSAVSPSGMIVVDGYDQEGAFNLVTLSGDFSVNDAGTIGPGQIPNFDPLSDSLGASGNLVISADGNIFISALYMHDNYQPEGTYLIRFAPTIPIGSGYVSGYIYNDANGNGVIDAGEQPLRYAQAFVDLNGNGKFDLGEPTGYADYNGYYTIYGAPAGTCQVYEVPQAGYTQDAPSATPYRTVTVTAGFTTSDVDFGNRAPQPGSISGTFFYDSNTNGAWDSGEAPSPYWGVYIDANNDGKYDSGDTEVIANGAGQYTFKNLAPGTYTIRGTTASGWTQTFPSNGGAQTVTVGSGQAVTGINFGEFHGAVSTAKGSISGTFFYDSNHNGVWDSGEPISPYWGVYIDANNDGKYDSGDTEIIANSKGQFTFPNLPAGTYVIRGTTASGWTQTSPANGGAQIVTIAAGQNLSNINFGEYHGIVSSGATGSISGTFFYDSNANGIWDAGETDSPSWGVYIDANDDGVYDSGDTELIANTHGQYTFSNLSAGTYVIRATTASGWKQTFPANGGAQVITLASGQNATGVNFGKVRT